MRLRRAAAIAVLVIAAGGSITLPAEAAPPGESAVEPYYTVAASYQEGPENLWEIADRFLGDSNRAGEILARNADRVQRDGGRVADPSRLKAGWILVLPWDAAGAGLNYGTPSAGTVAPSPCRRDLNVPPSAVWGQELLTPSRTWAQAAGAGIEVAVISSGVDGATPELAGRIHPGADVTGGAGRGDADCEGTGTALAGIVAGDDGDGGGNFGVAPQAEILPIRTGATRISTRVAATAIDVAADAGAEIILIGTSVDATDSAVRTAIGDAIARDVVVVLPATAASPPADGLLRVGAVAENGQPVEDHPGGSVDVLAPGANVATIGRSGNGPSYAAAFVAGTVALVRSQYPALSATDVAAQVRDTASEGLLSPLAAVGTPPAGGAGGNAGLTTPASGLLVWSWVLLYTAAVLAGSVLLWFSLRSPARALIGVLAGRRARYRALSARTRLAADNDDPFWAPPANGPSRDPETMPIRYTGRGAI